MADPNVVSSVVSGVEMLAGGGAAGGVLKRLLGPSADELAEAMRRWTSFRVNNVTRIVDSADKKSDGSEPGEVHPRIVHRLLEEGSYCDDELMAEYLGGVLAGSRSAGGRDDRAVAWSDLVTGLSALQVRAHFLIYRELARLIAGRGDVEMSLDLGRERASIFMPYVAFAHELTGDSDPRNWNAAVTHTVPGLVRLGLLDQNFAFGNVGLETVLPGFTADEADLPGLAVRPAFAGIELYGWAQGLPGLTPNEFPLRAEVFETDPPTRAIAGARLPLLHSPAPAETA